MAIPITGTGANENLVSSWLPVLEELAPAGQPGPFALTSTSPLGSGLVALRINYPFQAATLAGYQGPAGAGPGPQVGDAHGNPVGQVAVVANDSEAGDAAPPTGSIITGTTSSLVVYSGTYGLGSLVSGPSQVRPFRKVLSMQAVFRREVYSGP